MFLYLQKQFNKMEKEISKTKEVNGAEFIKDWQERAIEKGTTLTEICRELNYDNSFTERWKIKLPASLVKFFQIESVLNK